MLILRSCFVDRATSTAASFADVQSSFVSEPDWLEVAFGIVQGLAAIIGRTLISDVIALTGPKLRDACGPS